MTRHAKRLWLGVAVACAGIAPGAAQAQVGRGSVASGTYGASPAFSANPYANPYMNPFMNPYMAQYPTSPGNAALFFMAAQSANGGLGSGQLSGTRPAPGAALAGRTRPPAPTVARAEPANASMTPGGNAAHYFNRNTNSSGGASQYYNRQGRYFPKNGH